MNRVQNKFKITMKCTFERAVQDRLKEQSRLGGAKVKRESLCQPIRRRPFRHAQIRKKSMFLGKKVVVNLLYKRAAYV